jgi:hypothetical protein
MATLESNAVLNILKRYASSLRTLDLSHLACVNDALLLASLDLSFPRLRVLDLSFCTALTPAIIEPLRDLEMKSTGRVTVHVKNCWRLARPRPELTPVEALTEQLQALRANGPDTDEGIAKAFEFASPSNKQITGPVPRFISMIKHGYGMMLSALKAEIGPRLQHVSTPTDAWHLLVRFRLDNGRASVFVFILEKQDSEVDPSLVNCWMTAGVQGPIHAEGTSPYFEGHTIVAYDFQTHTAG